MEGFVYLPNIYEGVANHRSSSLTLVVRKLFGKMLKEIIFSFDSERNVITGCQTGFVPLQSCLSYLLLLKEMVIWLMYNSNTAYAVYLDFAKSFDLVSHRFL